MACPFFAPTVRADNLALPHPARLPLGAAWRGGCTVPSHESDDLAPGELESCNLGYAHSCPRLPKDRVADAVRFAVAKESPETLLIHYVLEAAHLPVSHGALEYDRVAQIWKLGHPDSRIQHSATCFLQSYLERSRAA